ncbi:unnamed protein product, partial [Pleuronectes platessa]
SSCFLHPTKASSERHAALLRLSWFRCVTLQYMDERSTDNLPWAGFHCANTRFSGQGQAATFSDMTKQRAV